MDPPFARLRVHTAIGLGIAGCTFLGAAVVYWLGEDLGLALYAPILALGFWVGAALLLPGVFRSVRRKRQGLQRDA